MEMGRRVFQDERREIGAPDEAQGSTKSKGRSMTFLLFLLMPVGLVG
jgi:hypothetical protein